MEATTLNNNNSSSVTSQPNFVAAALSAFSNINNINNHRNAAAAAGLLASLGARQINSNQSASSLTNGNQLNNTLNPFSNGHFAANLAAAAISPYSSLPSSYADFYHNFNLLNQQQLNTQQETSTANSNSPILNNVHQQQSTNQTSSLINQTASNGLYNIDNLLSPSMLSSANLIAHLNSVNSGALPSQSFAKNASLAVLRATENGLKQKKGDLLNNGLNNLLNTKDQSLTRKDAQLNNLNNGNSNKRQSMQQQLNGQTRCNSNINRTSPSQLNISSFHHQLAAAAAAAGLSNGHPLLNTNNTLNLPTSPNGQLTNSLNSNSNSSTNSLLKQQNLSPKRDLNSPIDLYNQSYASQNEHRSRRCSSPNSTSGLDRSNQMNYSNNSHNSDANSRGNSRERSDSEERDAKRRRTRTNFNGWQLEELEKAFEVHHYPGKKENTKKGPGRPAHNAHPQSCSGEPIPPDELIRRDKERRERKLRKQLERQARRLQQSSGRTTANTGTLMEAIRQTIIELRALNAVKEAPQLIGAETLRILLANQVDVMKILREFKPEMSNRKYHQQLTSQLGFGKSNKNNSFNPFSIENLLAGSKHDVNSLNGQMNSMFGNVGALAGLGVGALGNLGHYANNGQFTEAFGDMQAINNGAFASAAAAALANAQLNAGEHFGKHGLGDLSDMDDDDSNSAGSYMSDELDVMMDDDVSDLKSNEKLSLLNENNNQNGDLLEKKLIEKENELNRTALMNSLAMKLVRKRSDAQLDEDSCSNSSIDSNLNSNNDTIIKEENKFKKRKNKDDSGKLNKTKKLNKEDDSEESSIKKEQEDSIDETNENSSKETNKLNNHTDKKRILSELNKTIKDETNDNQLTINQNVDEQTEQFDKQTEKQTIASSSGSD